MLRYLILLTIAAVAVNVAHAQEQGQNYTEIQGLEPLVRDFSGFGHGGSKCIYCHAFLMPDREYEQKFLQAGCRCHQSDVADGYNVRMNDVRKLHDSYTCKRCHAGTRNVTLKLYHLKVHRNVSCTKCHAVKTTPEFTVTRPSTMECKSCHTYDIHFTHSRVLGKACKLCHGTKFANRFTEEDLKKAGIKEEWVARNETTKPEEVKKRGFITISKILAFIADLIS